MVREAPSDIGRFYSLSHGERAGVRGLAAWYTPLKPFTLTLSRRERGRRKNTVTTTQTTAETNPLLQPSLFPRFDLIRPEHIVPAMRQLLPELETELQRLEAQAQPTWVGLVEPLERITDRLSVTWGIVGHLMGVKNSDALREAHQTVQPEVVQFSMRLGQSPAIYQSLKALKAGPAWSACDPAQRRIVDLLIRDAELSGIGLQGPERERFNEIQQELARLSTEFSNHVLDATKAFALTLDQPEDVAGSTAKPVTTGSPGGAPGGRCGRDTGTWAVAHHPGLPELWPVSGA